MFFNEFESNIEKFKANGQEFSVHFGAIWQKLVLALQPITVPGMTITVNYNFLLKNYNLLVSKYLAKVF